MAGNRARQLKATALRQLGFRQMSINWRDFYLTATLELEDGLDGARYDVSRGTAILARLPLANLLENVVLRIGPERPRTCT